MELFVNISILTLQILVLIRSIYNLKKNFLDFSAWFYILYLIFFVPLFWDMYLDLGIFQYAYEIKKEYDISCSSIQLTFYNAISFFITLAFEIGYSLGRKLQNNNEKLDLKIDEKKYIGIQTILFLVWFIILIYEILKYDGNLIMFFLPSTKNIIQSFYIKNLFYVIPLIMFTLNVCKDNVKYHKTRKSVLFYIIIIFITTFSNGQRREVISNILYIFLILIFRKYNVKELLSSVLKNKYLRKFIKFGLVAIVLLVSLWYCRVGLNQIQSGKSDIQNPLKVRSFNEIIYGSLATGLPTFIAMDNFFESHDGIPYFRNIHYLFTSMIPRSIYPNKLEALTEYMQTQLGATFNLSLFYVCDMYYTFGIFGIIFSIIFGYYFSKLYNRNMSKMHLRYNALSLLMFSQIILLYKNGFVAYIIKLLFYMIFMEIAIRIVFRKGKSLNEK